MAEPTHSPRVLRMTFEFHVPEGLKQDVRVKRVETAVERITSAVQALTPTVFPWADRVSVGGDWSYRWYEQDAELKMPSTADNTVV
jgi:hypothetical protein